MNSIRKLLVGTALAAGTLIAAGASVSLATAADTAPPQAQAPGGHHWGHHGHHRGGFMYAKLGLTDSQKAQIKTIHQTAAPQMKTLFEQMHANSAKLKQMSPSDPNYINTVQSVSQANAPLQAQLAVQRASIHQEIFTKVLTGEQQTTMLQMRAQMEQKMQQRMQQRAAGAGST
jgi:Spy/CpxP family protein refolding chaperone